MNQTYPYQMVMNPVREKNEIANQVKIKPLIKGTSSVTSSLAFIQVFWKPQYLLSGHMLRNHFCLVANMVALCSFQKVVGKAGTCLSSPNVAGVQSLWSQFNLLLLSRSQSLLPF